MGVDSIAGTMGLIDKQNVTNYLAVIINQMAEFQQATNGRRGGAVG
jgi:hypothetical protein